MTGISILYFVYAALLLAGGIFGYARAKSAASLVVSAVVAVVAVIAGALFPHYPRIGLALGALASAVVEIASLRRFQQTKKPMPALPLLAVSGIVLLVSVVELAGRLSTRGV